MIQRSSTTSSLIALLRLDFSLPSYIFFFFCLSSLNPTFYLSPFLCRFALRWLLCVTWQPAFLGVCSTGMHSEVCRSVWRRGLAYRTHSHAVNNPALSLSSFFFFPFLHESCSIFSIFHCVYLLTCTHFMDCSNIKIAKQASIICDSSSKSKYEKKKVCFCSII